MVLKEYITYRTSVQQVGKIYMCQMTPILQMRKPRLTETKPTIMI